MFQKNNSSFAKAVVDEGGGVVKLLQEEVVRNPAKKWFGQDDLGNTIPFIGTTKSCGGRVYFAMTTKGDLYSRQEGSLIPGPWKRVDTLDELPRDLLGHFKRLAAETNTELQLLQQ